MTLGPEELTNRLIEGKNAGDRREPINASGQTADEFRSAGRSDLFAAQGSALASLISIQCPSGSWK